jgi:hypothetical protein
MAHIEIWLLSIISCTHIRPKVIAIETENFRGFNAVTATVMNKYKDYLTHSP